MQRSDRYRCVIMRGGTSKAVFFRESDLPRGAAARERVILAAFGSPDPRQIDGLGGADITTSKVAIIGPSSRPDADVDYTFGQVQLERAAIDYSANCGNISSAVGPFALEEGLVRAVEPITTVRIHNTNTRAVIVARVPVVDGMPAVEGDFAIPGVPGTGARIELDYAGTAGAITGRLLPTGRAVDELEVEGLGRVDVSIVDAANTVAFVRAEAVGARGDEHRAEIQADVALRARLEAVRAAAAEAAGFVKERGRATSESPLLPMLVFVTAPADYRDYVSGAVIPGEAVDFLARNMFNQMAVETFTGTGTICTAVAAMIPGTVVAKAASDRARASGRVRIGHPRGVIEVEAAVDAGDGGPRVRRVAFGRTARRLLEGYVFVRRPRSEA